MTENRKRVTVSIATRQRTVTMQTPAQVQSRTVVVEALPIREREIEPYDGDYTVDPLFTAQTLQTNGLRMTDDVTINPIYVADTSNPAGGTTVYIGGEFNG